MLCSVRSSPRPINRTNARKHCIAHGRVSPSEDSFFSEGQGSELMQESLMDSMLQDMQQDQQRMRELTKELNKQSRGPNYTYQHEHRGPGYYRYESVTVWSSYGNRPCSGTPAHQSGSGAGLALIAAGTLAALYTVLGAVFWSKYSGTRFEDMAQWQLTLLWPFLYTFNKKFRTEFRGVFSRKQKSDSGSDDVGDAPGASL